MIKNEEDMYKIKYQNLNLILVCTISESNSSQPIKNDLRRAQMIRVYFCILEPFDKHYKGIVFLSGTTIFSKTSS